MESSEELTNSIEKIIELLQHMTQTEKIDIIKEYTEEINKYVEAI